MKKPALVLSCILVVLPALDGCYTQMRALPAAGWPSSTPAAHRPVPWVPPPPGLDFSLSVDPAVFDLGDSVTLTVTVANEAATPFEARFSSGCNIDFDVYSNWGEWLGPYRACNQFGSVVRLEPGERQVMTRRWGNHYFNALHDLAPGVYWVTAGFVGKEMRVAPMVEAVRVEIAR